LFNWVKDSVWNFFLRSIVRSGKILLQKCEILCNAPQMMDCRNAYFRKGTQRCERMRKSLVLNYKSAALVRLSYDAYVIYIILGDVFIFVLIPVVHRSPLECRLPMKKSAMAEGLGFVRCAALRPPVVRRRRSRMQSTTPSARPKL